jgi:FG-GAP-like repeat
MTRRIGRLFVCISLVAAGAACGGAETPARVAAPDAALVAATNTAIGHMGRYDFQAAVDVLTPLAATHPASAATTFNLAVALINRQRAEDAPAAERHLRAVLDNPAVGPRARYALGLLLLYQGRDAEAFPLLTAVATATPADPFAAYFAGQARLAEAPAEALGWFEKARAIDPLLRSASYGQFQALQRTGRPAEAATALDTFQALETDPRARMAEFKYTRMGPLAEAMFVDAPTAPPPAPAGAPFEREAVLHALSPPADRRPAVSLSDLDGDGALDVFVAGAGSPRASNLVLRGAGTVREAVPGHPLAAVPDVRAALWGDIDNDGRVDAVLVRGDGRTLVWRQSAANIWQDVTTASRAATPGVDAIDGALFDADHDGDLDLWLTNAGGPDVLLNNNGNGTFRSIGASAGLATDPRPSLGLAIADLDADRDHDLVVLKTSPPHAVWLNDRVWRYRPAPGFEVFAALPHDAVLAADLDANGQPELYTTSPRGLERWSRDDGGVMRASFLAPLVRDPAQRAQLAIADIDGDGGFELVVSSARSWEAYAVPTTGQATAIADGGTDASAWTVATLDVARGPSIVGVTAAGLVTWAPGPGRHAYATLATTGRSQSSDQRRSNVSGIGTRVAVRRGSRWTAFDSARTQSGPGQSLQPMAVGLGGAARADLVSLVWSDGILQSELHLDGGRLQVIEETQRQLSSCPVLFAFDGTSTRFVTDILGVGGIGFFEQPGVYSAPFPREHVLLPEGALGMRDGRYRLVVGEPMEEVAYIDQLALAAYDLPPGWQMALDERKAIASAPPTGAPIFFREERLPSRAVNDRGADVTARVTAADLDAAPVGAADSRFIGLAARHTLELGFDTALDRGPGRPVLMIDGWVEYPYAQTVFAAWQAGAAFAAPTLEARDGAGRWRVVAPDFGYPAGMPRRMTLPLPSLPPGTTALRLSTSQEVYWDRVAVVYAEPLPSAIEHVLPMADATLRESGFARRSTGAQRTPAYDYARRAPLGDTRHPRGWYTAFGEVAPLVDAADDALAIVGPGEELGVEFAAPPQPPPAGWTRRFVLRARGWCKDMDLYTRDGDTVAPLPGRETAARAHLHAAFNTRFESGR